MKFKAFILVFPLVALMAFTSVKSFAATYTNSQFLVETGWLSEHLNDPDLKILDVRKDVDYEQSHVPKAIHLNLPDTLVIVNGIKGMLAPVEKIESLLGAKGINNQSQIIIYDDTTGPVASRVFWMLDYLGHKNMALLNGGWSRWTSENREVTRQIPMISPGNFQASPQSTKLATGQWLLGNLHSPDLAILDVRSYEEFTGKEARSTRGGHIPEAIHLEWKNNLTGQGTVKPAADLRNMYYRAQIKKEKEIVVYCQNGIRASQSYFVLRLLGYERVRLYDGSWQEWGNDNRFPVETGKGAATGKNTATC